VRKKILAGSVFSSQDLIVTKDLTCGYSNPAVRNPATKNDLHEGISIT
jgi:hypothetical protein